MKLVALPLLFALFCVGCTTTGTVTSEQLKYTQWQLSKVNGLAIPVSQTASIRFIEAMQVNGFAGCNRFFGEGEIVEGQLKVKNLGMTRKYCGEEIAQVESQLINQLQIGVLLEVNANKLTLKGKPQFSFIKQ